MSPVTIDATVHLASVVLPCLLLVVLVRRRRPDRREAMAVVLSGVLSGAGIVVLDDLARRIGWWHLGVGPLDPRQPLELVVAWALLWGPLPTLLPRLRPTVVLTGLVVLDLLTLPLLPDVALGRGWAVGEALGIVAVAAPAVALGRWTAQRRHLRRRVALQVWMAALLVLGVPTVVALAQRPGPAVPRPGWAGVGLQLVAVGALLAVAAVSEFCLRGQGTPWPWDPPRRVVTTGPYRYLRNPMQAGTLVVLTGLALVWWSPWPIMLAITGLAFSTTAAALHERSTIARHHPATWDWFATTRRAWVPRWRPEPARSGASTDRPVATLWIGQTCGTCSPLAAWFTRQQPRDLDVRPAEDFPDEVLRRAAWVGEDGDRADGVVAVAHALEHVTLDWAMIGFLLRLPVVATIATTIADATGFGPRDPLPRPATRSTRAGTADPVHAVAAPAPLPSTVPSTQDTACRTPDSD